MNNVKLKYPINVLIEPKKRRFDAEICVELHNDSDAKNLYEINKALTAKKITGICKSMLMKARYDNLKKCKDIQKLEIDEFIKIGKTL